MQGIQSGVWTYMGVCICDASPLTQGLAFMYTFGQFRPQLRGSDMNRSEAATLALRYAEYRCTRIVDLDSDIDVRLAMSHVARLMRIQDELDTVLVANSKLARKYAQLESLLSE